MAEKKEKRRYGKSGMEKRLSAGAVRSFSELFLAQGYDGSKPIPAVHDEWWEMCCSPHPRVAIAAPRGHAKSTAITLAYVLASVCLRYKRYVVIVANTEDVANDFLSGIRDELRHNKELREVFGIKDLPTDGSTSCIVRFTDGSRARIRTKGAAQKVRGMLWNQTRPDLVVIDDLEDDEAVESQDRRQKLKSWMLKALLPCVSQERGQIRMVGTILHLDSILTTFVASPSWESRLYKAHTSFTDYSNLLWPEMWPVEKLQEIQQEYIDLGDPEGYSQEYLNDPSDLQNPFFREDDFIPMSEDDYHSPKSYYVGCDFALSDSTHSDFTVLCVGGYDSNGTLHIVDERRIRTNDTSVVIDELFSLQARWSPDMYLFEGGVIANAILPAFRTEMRKRNQFATVHTYTPIMDKRLRAGSIQQRLRSGGVRYDVKASWYEGHVHELRRFPKGKKKDRVDAIAWLGRGVDEFVEAPTQQEIADDEWQNEWDSMQEDSVMDFSGTGY